MDDGGVAIIHDGSGNVTELHMRSDSNETLRLTGDAMTFASGARIITGQNTNIIENSWTAEGNLSFGIANMTVGVNLVNGVEDATVLSGVRLDEISPVSAAGTGSCYFTDGAPYFVARWNDGTTERMTAEFQATEGNYIKGVAVEFWQEGDDIKGKWITGGWFPCNSTTNALGWSIVNPTIPLTTNTGYGLKSLTFGPRREEFVYTNGLLTTEFDTVVAKNVSVEDIEILHGSYSYKRDLGGMRDPTTMYPRHVAFSGGVLSAQMVSSKLNRCVKIELAQSGADVVGRVVYARHSSTSGNYDEDGKIYTLSTSYGTKGYGCDMLALRRKSLSRAAFAVSGAKTLPAMAGNGMEVIFDAAATATVTASGANTMTDSAYVIRGDTSKKMTFNVTAQSLPAGRVDVYGEGTLLDANYAGNMAAGAVAITNHPGTVLGVSQMKSFMDQYANTEAVLDAATAKINGYGNYCLNHATLANGSCVTNGSDTVNRVRIGYNSLADDCRWTIAGEGASTCYIDIMLFPLGSGVNGTRRAITFDVGDTVAGDGADFIVKGGFLIHSSYPNVVCVKTGAGTMQVDGSVPSMQNALRVAEGTLYFTKNGGIDENSSFSLEGGTLAFVAGTANTCAGVTLTDDSGMTLGTGATIAMSSLTIPDGAALTITCGDGTAGAIDQNGVKVSTALDSDTLSRIRINGKRVCQSSGGYLRTTSGLIISIY